MSPSQSGEQTTPTQWVATPAAGSSPPSLTVDGQSFFARGVAYSPVPWGADANWAPYGDFMFPPWNGVWNRDLPAMRNAGINVIRTYNIENVSPDNGAKQDHSHFLNACWNGGTNPIYVLVGFGPLNNLAIYDPWDSTQPKRDAARKAFLAMVAAYAAFPAVMGFIIGNEVNSVVTRDNSNFWKWLNDLAGATKAAAPGKLTLLALVDDSMKSVSHADKNMPKLDVWGINTYRGQIQPANANNFNNLWNSFAQLSKKPLLISEWGAPASTHDGAGHLVFTGPVVANLDTYITGHYTDITYNSVATTTNGGANNPNAANWAPVCVGSCYFEWTDEWWKLDGAYSQEKCPATIQNVGLAQNPAFPGGWDDEECFGLNAIKPSGGDPFQRTVPPHGKCPGPWNFHTQAPYLPDILRPRQSLATLTKLFKAT